MANQTWGHTGICEVDFSLTAIVPYEPHPHVAIIRDFLGYVIDEPLASEDDSDNYLKSLDPKDWKTQDHYAILGLKHLRYQASADDIRRAYRRKLLGHHPDKRRHKGELVKDESHDYFSCLTIANEILSNPIKRHAYDSVDPFAVDDSVPTLAEIKANFYATLTEFFGRKARWSKIQPVPILGSDQTCVDEVHRFYDFWEIYDTTRDYSYLDEEDKEKGDCREARRAIERENRVERARRRAEEIKSVRQIVDFAKVHDPRLLAETKAVRDAKAAKRQARLDTIRAKKVEEDKLAQMEVDRTAAARAADEERRRTEAERLRKEREQNRVEAKREHQRLRTMVVENFDHFVSHASQSPDADAERVRTLANMDLLCQRLSTAKLRELNNRLEHTEVMESAQLLFSNEVTEVQRELQAPGLSSSKKSVRANTSNLSSTSSKFDPELVPILIKAVNLLPAGTPKRWEAIAAYVNQHHPGASLSPKDALRQAKALSQDNSNLRKEANAKAFDSFTNSVRETDAVKNVSITTELEADVSRPWTVDEQRALEQALRSYPAGNTDNDRWQRIADIVGTRTRRECMLRCKELAEQVKAKKAAMAAAKSAAFTPATPVPR